MPRVAIVVSCLYVERDLRKLTAEEFVLLAPDRVWGQVTRLGHNYRESELLVFLSPELLKIESEEGILAVSAHELTHVLLGHEETKSANAFEDARKGEADADVLATKWGFDISAIPRSP